MKRVWLPLALVALSAFLVSPPANAQSCSIGGHNETSEFFGPTGGWAIINMSPGTIVGAPSGTHLVFSEVAPRGAGTGTASDSSEYIEIYNPTANPVKLDDKYISDDIGYYRIVNAAYPAANASDWALKFPIGLALNPGRTLVLCVTKAGFAGSGASAAGAQYFLEMRDSNANPTDDMVILTTGSTFLVTGGNLTNPSSTNGEWVVLYCWNGTSDLVCDIDYASWGANSASNPKMDKTGISIDGPDADALPSAYNADIAAATQTNLGSGATLTKPNTYQRVGGEVGEVTLGGNGCVGRVIPTVIGWVPVTSPTGGPNIRFQVRWMNPDDDAPSTAFTGSMMSQEFGVFLPDYGQIGSFNVPPIPPASFFDVFIEIPLASLPPAPQKIVPMGGAGGPAKLAPASFNGVARTMFDCPPDTNWAGNVDIIWSGPGQGGQVNKHYADLLTCIGGAPSYIHFRGSNCPAPMPWTLTGVCPGYTVKLVNEDFSPAPNPVPVGWSSWICVSVASSVPSGTSCCFGIVFQCQGSTSTVVICSTACECQPHPPTLSQIDWTTIGTMVRFHQRWENMSANGSSDPVSGNMNSQMLGVFLPDFGPIGAFNVPPIPPSSFFDVFIDVPLSQLPPEPVLRLPGGTPGVPNPCVTDHWHGNVNVTWNGAGGAGQVFKHFGEMPVCPGAAPTYLFIETDCLNPAGAPWTISGLCPGFSATLVNTDLTPAPNPVPPGWIGMICVSATAATPLGTTCCFTVKFLCADASGVLTPGIIDVCANTCYWGPIRPVLAQLDWTNIGTMVRFHQRWENPDPSRPSEPASGDMSSQSFGVFMPNAGPIGHFDVPPLTPNSFFDVFFDVPLSQLPAEPPTVLPGGGPPANSPCPPPTAWHGNVDVTWNSAGTPSFITRHFGELLVCPGAGPSYIHMGAGCPSPVGIQWSISGLCPGFGATLVNEDFTPAPNPLPPNWLGWICVSAPATTPVGATCCFKVSFLCDGVPADIEVCAKTCDWRQRRPVLAVIDWKRIGTTVRFHQRWTNPDNGGDTEPVSGHMMSQPFGVFAPDFGPIGAFNVPPMAPNSFFDVFFDVPLSALPPEPQKILPGGGPAPNGAARASTPTASDCPPDTSWSGTVDINWAGSGFQGQTNYHFTGLLVRPRTGSSHVHTLVFCNSQAGATWSIAGLCPGFSAILLNEDFTPAPNPVPPNWTGWISVAAAGSVPSGVSCCFTVTFLCPDASGLLVPGVIEVCAETCQWAVTGVPLNTANVDFGIYATAPNPTNADMLIGFAMPKSGNARLDIYNLSGQRVRTLLDGPAAAGVNTVRWDGRGEGSRALAPGAYFIRLKAGERVASKKVLLYH